MTPFAFSEILILISGLSMGALVLIKTPKIYTNRLWAYFNFAMAIWGFAGYQMAISHTPEKALFWMRLAHIGIITIPVFFLHFASRFFEKENKNIIITAYSLALFFIMISPTKLFIRDILPTFGSMYYRSSYPTVIYTVFFCLWITSAIYALSLAYKNINNVSPIKRNQTRYLFLIITLGYIGGLGNFLPVFGILIYPYGNFLVCILILSTTYVILKYNLLDITIVIRRGLIYSLVATSITLIFFIFVLTSEYLFHHAFHYHSILYSLLMICFFTLIFTPLKNKIQDLVDRAFFKATPMEMADQNEKLKAIATLASGMAHEIKNPLTTLKTFAEYVPQRKDDPKFMEQYQKIIPQEIDRIDNLVHELLFFAKPSPPQMQAINPNAIITNLMLMLEQKLQSSKIDLNLQFNTNTTIQADPNQLKQALFNLTLNAIDAMPNGGTLTINTSIIANPAFGVIARSPEEATKQSFIIEISDTGHGKRPNCFVIEISDTGCGIDAKDLPHIFEPFFTKKEKGTGLGLAITQGIIEKHSGKITAQSELGKGTTFTIKLNQEIHAS